MRTLYAALALILAVAAGIPGRAAASHLYLTLGFLPEITMEESIVVRGIRTPGVEVTITVNGRVEASVNPENNIYGVRVPIRAGLNRIAAKAAAGGETLVEESQIFRTTVDFADMEIHWAEYHAEILASLGIVSGVGPGVFGPDLQVTRAQFAKMVVLAANLESLGEVQLSFKDAAQTPEWAQPFVAAAVRHGLIAGFEDNTFRPDQPITRAQIAVILARALRLKGVQPESEPRQFVDQDAIPGWALADVSLATRAGIISGYEDGRFGPTRTATRGEAAAMIRRLWQAQQ